MENNAAKKRYRRPREVAEVEGVTIRTVQRWCERGMVQFRKGVSGRLRILVDSDGFALLADEPVPEAA